MNMEDKLKFRKKPTNTNEQDRKLYRVQKLISNWGYCSRRKAEELIEKGAVKVNGKKIKLGDKASINDEIKIYNKIIKPPRKIYLMLNKPIGCVTAAKDPKQKTVMNYIYIKERVFPIGRLDKYTSGLLLFTNDGDFANRVMHPRYEIKKTYIVEATDDFTEKQISQIKHGIMLEDGKTNPAWVKQLNKRTLKIEIHEGRNRIVRRMVQALGLKVRNLQRVAIGKLELGDLAIGKTRKLSKNDLEKIFK
jgi:23S rRNA pseudouridine2605 synthase